MFAHFVVDIAGLHHTQDAEVGHLDKAEAEQLDVVHALDNSNAALRLPGLRVDARAY